LRGLSLDSVEGLLGAAGAAGGVGVSVLGFGGTKNGESTERCSGGMGQALGDVEDAGGVLDACMGQAGCLRSELDRLWLRMCLLTGGVASGEADMWLGVAGIAGFGAVSAQNQPMVEMQ
jgi:hypothetical protein